MAGGLMMSGMSGASMLRTRRRDVNLKPNRRLDRKSSRGMLYENEELRLRTININAEVERGQSDIKKLKRENEQLKREISALRYEYDRLDSLLRERRLSVSPVQSDDSASICSACPECAVIEASPARAQVSFNDLTVVPEEDAEGIKSSIGSRCSCEECSPHVPDNPMARPGTNGLADGLKTQEENGIKPVDVLVHDSPPAPKFFQTLTSPPYQSPPPPPGFNISPYQTPAPRFKNGGNVEDLLGDMRATPLHTTFIQQNSVFMCNTKKVMQKPCQCCLKAEVIEQKPKHYVTEKNIELNYDYPRATPLTTPSPNPDAGTTTTEVASTVVFVERRIPVRPRKFDFFFRSRSAPVGENEEPIYATVNKLPKRLKRMELANLEKEVEYKTEDARIETKTDSEQSQAPIADDDTSPSEVEKVVQSCLTPKGKKRKRFSLTFKKRERKRREMKKELNKNTAINGIVPVEENNRLLNHDAEVHNKHCARHRPRNTLSSSSSGPRYRRDSYQEMTTSHSEHERTNSMCSSMNSLASACTHKSRKLSAAPTGDAIPWCGCWGAGCV